ncbi:unnamed protein product [Sphagnum troendelagicum]|uniref:BHLH domain-containing protein n=1 Tax=Sphagnum troendelagicum TaxID=128251 RepID=A0ABP0U4F1_9BRYO
MELLWLPAPAPTSADSGSCSRRDINAQVDAVANVEAFDGQLQPHAEELLVLQLQPCCRTCSKKVDLSFPSLAARASVYPNLEDCPVLVSFNIPRWPSMKLAPQHETIYELLPLCASNSSSSGLDSATAAAGSISRSAPIESSPDILLPLDHVEQHSDDFQKHNSVQRPCRKRSNILLSDLQKVTRRTAATGTGLVSLLSPSAQSTTSFGAGYSDGQKKKKKKNTAAGTSTSVAMANNNAVIQETRSCWGELVRRGEYEPAFVGTQLGAAATHDHTATNAFPPLQEAAWVRGCNCSNEFLHQQQDLVVHSADSENYSSSCAVKISTDYNTLRRDLKSEQEQELDCDCSIDIKPCRSSTSKTQKRRFRYTHRVEEAVDDAEHDDAYEEDNMIQVMSSTFPRPENPQDRSSSSSMPLQLEEGPRQRSCRNNSSLPLQEETQQQPTCRNFLSSKKRSVRSGSSSSSSSLESTAFSNRYSAASREEEYYSCSATKLKLRKKVKVLRGMIPPAAAAAAARGSSQDTIMSSTTTDTSLVLDEAIHYVKLLQLHVQMLRTGGSKPKE